MKKEVGPLDATPTKRLYLSIIADYDLNRAICELVDNAIDVWTRSRRRKKITIKINLDTAQQTITIEDNAGGLPQSELVYVVSPGQTGTDPTDQTIGMFGVGTKRAVVALAQDIKIKTRFKKDKTFQVDLDDDWLQDDEWEIPFYEVDEVAKGSTIIELQKLRVHITDESITQLRDHLSATYAKFISSGKIIIKLNGTDVSSRFFENWAFPPKYGPRKYCGDLKIENRIVKVEAYGGLALESSPSTGDYGVYFYCNDRLVARALKSFEVGFVKGFAGQPHAKISLTRVIVFLSGDARDMPWNSSKSDINVKHEVFRAIQNWLMTVVKDYATLSRIWTGDWERKVFRYPAGPIEEVHITDFPVIKKSFLPPPPRSRLKYSEIITQKNRDLAKKKPWTKGIYEGVIAADLISKKRALEQRNRIALILLDSTIEIAFKEYLVNDSGTYYTDDALRKIFSQRHLVHQEIMKYVTIDDDDWKKIAYYNNLRNKLVHERATVGISDDEIEDFREVTEKVLKAMYNLDFGEY